MTLAEFAKVVTFKKVDARHYDVIVLGTLLGSVYHEAETESSYYHWKISGAKWCYHTRLAAAYALSVMNSGLLVKEARNGN